ncbi:MAG: patatin-like phospholipase family protein [Pseudomonadota bacterium]
MNSMQPSLSDCHQETRILVLQGGGALGAYQAGVYEALAAAGEAPEWLAGISIGAINAALIAGNPPERRSERLRDFWQTVTATSTLLPPPLVTTPGLRRLFNEFSATLGIFFGLPGFFSPRSLRSWWHDQKPSFYDTAPLRATLERLIDFDLLNSGKLRLSVGAVNVRSGNFAYFDTARQRLDARHIMASGALPPGFPPIEIDGEWYWDGGLVSNTPLQYVLDQPSKTCRLVFQVDLFPAEGALPHDLVEAAEREKDIRFSSRTRLNTSYAFAQRSLAQAAHRLAKKLPPEWAQDQDLQSLLAASPEPAVTVVHLIHRRMRYETQSKDYEFSRLSMQERWQAGIDDITHTLNAPEWKNRTPPEDGYQVFDLLPHAQQSKR